jgi:AraC-like DNA-binding protein
MRKRTAQEQIDPRLNLRWVGRWAPGYVEQSRYLYDHELVVFLAGTSRVLVGDRAFTCAKGDALIIPPGVRHWTRAVDGVVERCCCHFDWVHGGAEVNPPFVYEADGTYVRRRGKAAPRWLKVEMPFWATGLSLPRLLPLLGALAECDRSPVGLLRRRGLFLQLLAEVLGGGAGKAGHVHGGKSLRLVQAVKQRIENDYRKPLAMSAMAKDLKVTPVHMARAFRTLVGMSPLAYLHRLRLEEACRLLSNSSMNVAEVADNVGFDDANYFSRLFRRKMGMSPSAMTANPASSS